MSDYSKKVREGITAKLVEAVENGTAPWQRPWDGRCGVHNAISGRAYTGINNLALTEKNMAIDKRKDPRWLTFKQASDKGWKVKKGSRGTQVLFWKPTYDAETQTEIVSVLERVFTVFHASQIDGIGEYTPPVWNEIALQWKAESIIKLSGAVIEYGGNRAYYLPSADKIQMPERGFFYTQEGYYSTLLHELIHWTKHETRLNRQLSYPQEELVAEIGAMFLSEATGIPQTEEVFNNHADYVKGWRTQTKDKQSAISKAAADANRAVNYLFEKAGLKVNDTEEEE